LTGKRDGFRRTQVHAVNRLGGCSGDKARTSLVKTLSRCRQIVAVPAAAVLSFSASSDLNV
jgi:hypothetical protein